MREAFAGGNAIGDGAEKIREPLEADLHAIECSGMPGSVNLGIAST
jgi:hypothetical protein